MTITLHGSGASGNACKVALMLQATGMPLQLRVVDFLRGAARCPEFLRLNEIREVSVLVDGGQVLTQAGRILDHLAAKPGLPGWAHPYDLMPRAARGGRMNGAAPVVTQRKNCARATQSGTWCL